MNGFRRQRLHLSNKSQQKIRTNEETKQSLVKDISVYKDFSELRLSCDENVSKIADNDRSKQSFFKNHFKFDSIDWREKCVKQTDKKTKSRKTASNSQRPKKVVFTEDKSCARQAMDGSCDASVDELAAYLDDTLYLPRKMSFMAEMMYT